MGRRIDSFEKLLGRARNWHWLFETAVRPLVALAWGAVVVAAAGFFAWAASAFDAVAVHGWGAAVIAGFGLACTFVLVVCAGLVAWRFFRPLPSRVASAPATADAPPAEPETVARLERDRSAPFKWKLADNKNMFGVFQIWNRGPMVVIKESSNGVPAKADVVVPELFPKALPDYKGPVLKQIDTFFFVLKANFHIETQILSHSGMNCRHMIDISLQNALPYFT